MHVLFREVHGMEETAQPRDLGQSPADLVVLSFSDGDLGAFAAAWHHARAHDAAFPSLRLANIAALAHPLSVDTYVERTLHGARAIMVRLIGGASTWRYGLEQVEALARSRGIVLAVVAGEGRADPRLDAASTCAPDALAAIAQGCMEGGCAGAGRALQALARAAGLAPDMPQARTPAPLPPCGGWHPSHGPCDPLAFAAQRESTGDARPLVLLVFYRSALAAGDVEPVRALHAAFAARGCAVFAIHVPSLRGPDNVAQVQDWVARLNPAAIVNLTAFSAADAQGRSPLDAAGCPVFQTAQASSTRSAWAQTLRGLGAADLAMHVALPEIDGRIFAGVVSFKDAGAPDPDLGIALQRHASDPQRVAAIAGRVCRHVALGRMAPDDRRVALVLSTYPGRAWQMAHAVGLDALASACAMLSDLGAAGYRIGAAPPTARELADALAPAGVSPAARTIAWPLGAYRAALRRLPAALREDLAASWGEPEDDRAFADGAFHFAAWRRGNVTLALQPERGEHARRDADYHDTALCPRHGYVAFHLWLRENVDALVQVGAHGTLEWLPGKAVALGDGCWSEALSGDLPVIYPFIVNDPGEAAQARRRIGALTLGHVPPPLVSSGAQGEGVHALGTLEALLDEFSAAVGLDPARRARLQIAIRAEAGALGLTRELDLADGLDAAEAIARIDRFVCEVKDARFGEGLHVYGRGTCGDAERDGLLRALAGRRVAAGPSGSPWRGRTEVLPTGRNLYAVDPRALPTRSAFEQGGVLAEELLRRHLQDHGDYPQALVMDLWGSATMRTAGEEFAMALHLIGAEPVWDAASGRVTGIEIVPLARREHPRIDVTLRISGLLRDAFPVLPRLFGQAVRAIAARDEPQEWNPFVAKPVGARVYGPAPGRFGAGVPEDREGDACSLQARRRAGEGWLAFASHAFDGRYEADAPYADPDGLRARVAGAQAFVHVHDLPEGDLLLAMDHAAHQGGFAAAQALLRANASGERVENAPLYHLDSRDPANVRARSQTEEIARVVRARAAHPGWIAGMMRHGYRGAAEIAATLDHLAAFAHLAGGVPDHLFDLLHDATVGDAPVRAFLHDANPQALADMEARFAALHRAGLWVTRRNAVLAGPVFAPSQRGENL